MTTITFADVAQESLFFLRENPSDSVVLALIDTPWVQRLRDISQTANTRLVYMFSEHSRFGHSVGVAYLAKAVLEKLKSQSKESVEEYHTAVCAAAILHDIGHLAPGSHTAYRTWYPNRPDEHEDLSIRIIESDPDIQRILQAAGHKIPELVVRILREDDSLPPWTWEIVSGGGWNVDRGNWCIVDSVMAGVSYGKYNIAALTDSMAITADGHLALRENRLDAMMHFAVSRHALYRQLYQHRVLLATDTINRAIAARARVLISSLGYCDSHMQSVLRSHSPRELDLPTVFAMREYWWRYHLAMWCHETDAILADLCGRLLNRRLFKTVRVHEDECIDNLVEQARQASHACGYDPDYYVHVICNTETLTGESQQSMSVLMDDGRVCQLSEADPLFGSLVRESGSSMRRWIAMPQEVKTRMGRPR